MAFYNCLLIDSDGTLLDFDAAEQTAFYNTMEHFSLPCQEQTLALYKLINKELWAAHERGEIKQSALLVKRFEALLEKLGATGNAAEINAAYLDNLSLGSSIIEGADEMLAKVSEVATIAVITNGIDKVQHARFSKSDIGKYVDAIYVSERVGSAKPQRKIFDVALSELGVSNRKKVLVVGDSLTADIKGGINAELDTCWCNFADLENNTDIKPTHTINNYDELLRIVMEEEELENVTSGEKRHKL